MFFIGVFGVSRNEKILAEIKIICDNCEKFSKLEVYESYSCFHVFFIPVLKWDKKYFAISNCCFKHYLPTDKAIEKISSHNIHELTERDFYCDNSQSNDIVCPFCTLVNKNAINFCPRCGNKLR